MTALKTILAAAAIVGVSTVAVNAQAQNPSYADQYEFFEQERMLTANPWIEDDFYGYEGRNSVVYVAPEPEGPFVERYEYVTPGLIYEYQPGMAPYDDIAERSGR